MCQSTLSLARSRDALAAAEAIIPGGVNSPVRANRAVGGVPVFVERGEGAYVWDIDGNKYLDFIMSWGPLILGHGHPEVVGAIKEQCEKGISYGMPTEQEIALAKVIVSALPSVEKVRLVNSGTEATMSALRLARAFTKRPKVIKFAGCYHGHADFLLVKAGSGALTFGSPDSAGVPEDFGKHTLVLPYNNVALLKDVFRAMGEEIAAVIVEPVVGNMGVVKPKAEFLEALATLPRAFGALLIFDEVMTGFRLAWGGVQNLYGIRPDITCLGKVIGGGLPVGAYGGRAEIMDLVAPLGPVYQAGTLSGNPLSVAAGLATLRVLDRERPYEMLDAACARLCDGLREAAKEAGVPVQVQREGSMFTVFFSAEPVHDLEGAKRCNTSAFAVFYHEMRARGVLLPPSQFEAAFLATAHGEVEICLAIEAARGAFRKVREVQYGC